MASNFRFKTAQSGRESSSLLKYAKNAGKFFATISGILPAMALTAAVAWGFLYCVNQVEAYAIKLPDGFKQYIYKPAWDFLDKSAQNCLFKSIEWMADPFTDSTQDSLNEASDYAESVGYGNSAKKTTSSEDEKLIKDKGADAVAPIVKKASRFTREPSRFLIGSLLNAFKVHGKEREKEESILSRNGVTVMEDDDRSLDGTKETEMKATVKEIKSSNFLSNIIDGKGSKEYLQARKSSFSESARNAELLETEHTR
jgi:hypothetical protein